MNRITVLQDIVNTKKNATYLEIGVAYGNVLFQINAKTKIGVEPHPPEGFSNMLAERAQVDPSLQFYEQTSNHFFRRTAQKVLADGVDLIFVDGMHTYSQALADVENGLKFLKEDGVIVMHDCNPLSFATAYPIRRSFAEVRNLAKKGEIPGWNGCWNGDVWKALVHLRITHPDLQIFTLDIDWGLGVLTRRKRRTRQAGLCTLDTLKHSDYSLLERRRVPLLNLKHPKYLQEFLSSLNNSRGKS